MQTQVFGKDNIRSDSAWRRQLQRITLLRRHSGLPPRPILEVQHLAAGQLKEPELRDRANWRWVESLAQRLLLRLGEIDKPATELGARELALNAKKG